jgi:hypothetical protein
MNKKILTTLLIASIAITGLFAGTYGNGNSAILEASQTDIDYTFVMEYNESGSFADTQTVSGLKLDATGGTTDVFDVQTSNDGNLPTSTTFTTTISTGEFVGRADASIKTGWYPTITTSDSVVLRATGSIEGFDYTAETVAYTATTSGDFSAPSVGKYVVTFLPGTHNVGSEISSFVLNYKGDVNVAAGQYTSTSVITITT